MSTATLSRKQVTTNSKKASPVVASKPLGRKDVKKNKMKESIGHTNKNKPKPIKIKLNGQKTKVNKVLSNAEKANGINEVITGADAAVDSKKITKIVTKNGLKSGAAVKKKVLKRRMREMRFQKKFLKMCESKTTTNPQEIGDHFIVISKPNTLRGTKVVQWGCYAFTKNLTPVTIAYQYATNVPMILQKRGGIYSVRIVKRLGTGRNMFQFLPASTVSAVPNQKNLKINWNSLHKMESTDNLKKIAEMSGSATHQLRLRVVFKRVERNAKMIKIYFQDFARTTETFIYSFDPNSLAFIWDNALVNAKELYDQLSKSKPLKGNQDKVFNENLTDSQSISEVMQLLQMAVMKDCVMIISKGHKTYGDFGNWFFKNKHTIVFFPQMKIAKPKIANKKISTDDKPSENDDSVYKFNEIDWVKQDICISTARNAREMAYMKGAGTSDNFPPFVILKNVCITDIKGMFKMTDANGDELVYGYDDNKVEDVNGTVRALVDSDEVSYNIRCSVKDHGTEDAFSMIMVTAWDEGGRSVFGKTAKEAYQEHGSVCWYEDACKNLVFDLVLKSWYSQKNGESKAGWTIAHQLNCRRETIEDQLLFPDQIYEEDMNELEWEPEQPTEEQEEEEVQHPAVQKNNEMMVNEQPMANQKVKNMDIDTPEQNLKDVSMMNNI